MAVDLSTSPGGLFRRLGRAGGLLNSLYSFLGAGDLSSGGLVSLGVGTDNLQNQFEASRQDLTSGLYAMRDSFRAGQGTLPQWVRQQATNVVVEMVNDDTKLPSKTLAYALAELRDQMVASSDSIQKPTVTASATAGSSNTGTGVCAVSVLDGLGYQLDYVFPESITIKVTTDSQGSATAGSEALSYAGAASQSDSLRWDYPLGSGCAGSLSATDAAADNDGKNLLQNSSFATFTTSNTPDNWPISVGTAGTSILQATGSNAYKGTSGLAFVGDGSQLTSIQQPFNTTPSTTAGSGGTSYRLLPSKVYAISCWVKCSATPAAGVLSLALVDGSGNILTDVVGTSNNVTQALTSVSTSWVNVKGFFRTPASLPTTAKLRIRLSTALESGRTVYIDHVAMAPATQLYTGGPYVAVFSGATDFLVNDKFTIAVANNYAASAKWALLLERLFGLRALGIRIPSAASSPTIDEAWIA